MNILRLQRISTWILLFGLTAVIVLAARSGSGGQAVPVAKAQPRVEVATLNPVASSRELVFRGVTQAGERARLAFAESGRLNRRSVELGDVVRRGQVLAELDDRQPRLAVESAMAAFAELQARHAQATRDQERVAQLAAAKAATQEELETAQAGLAAMAAVVDAARARLHQVERQLAENRLLAPFAGTVTEILHEPGEFVHAGQPILILSGEGAVELEVELPETVARRLQVGDEVQVILPDDAGARVDGKVTSVGRTALGPGRLFPLVVTLSEVPHLVAGRSAELLIQLPAEATLALPVAAVINPGGSHPAVFRLATPSPPHRVQRVEVEVLNLIGDRVLVRGDLRADDRVVVAGQHSLLDGDAVEVLGQEVLGQEVPAVSTAAAQGVPATAPDASMPDAALTEGRTR